MITVALDRPTPANPLLRLVDGFKTHIARRKVEDQLMALDDRQLADIGVARCDIRRLARQAA